MTPGIVCRSIDGYEDYELLPEAAQTSEEKLLVYFRPSGLSRPSWSTASIKPIWSPTFRSASAVRKRSFAKN